ncbi:MAG: HAD-IA family hydrolase [Pseudomonadota bacterium]
MTKAILLGSIGTIIESSEIQRAAFNDAFKTFELDWHWDRDSYTSMLTASGGKDRVQTYAASRHQAVDADAIHAKKTALFQAALSNSLPELRQGVPDVISHAQSTGCRLGFVTTTEKQTVDLIANSVGQKLGLTFDIVTFRMPSRPGKPDPAVYLDALARLEVAAQDAIAIEDNADGVTSAKAAGIQTIGFPGENTRADDLRAADCAAENDLLAALLDLRSTVAGPST